MRPARQVRARTDREPEVVTAIERLREALEPGQLRELLDRRRDEPDGGPTPPDASSLGRLAARRRLR